MEADRNVFLDALYGAAIGGGEWKPALAAYAKLVSGYGSIFHLYDLKTGTVHAAEWLQYPDDFIHRGREHWFARDPWYKAGEAKLARDPSLAKSGFVFHGSSEVPPHEYLRSDHYLQYSKQVEVFDCLACTTFVEGRWVLSMSTHTGGKSLHVFTRDQRRVADGVFKHFQRAMSLHIDLMSSRSSAAVAPWITSTLPVLLLNGHRIVFANAAAGQLVASGDIVGAIGGRAIYMDPELEHAIDSMNRRESQTSRQCSLTAIGRTGSRWLIQIVRINRLSGSILGKAGAEDPACIMVLTHLDLDAGGRTDALHAIEKLTPVERKIAVDLSSGWRIAAVAEERKLSVQTVRWHVRNLIEKMGARNLADLQRILALLLPF